MKYKVGDKVRIKSLDWYYANRDEADTVECGNAYFVPAMVEHCDKIVTISSILSNIKFYHIKEDGGIFNWSDEMIEGLVEEKDNDCEKCSLTRNSTRCLFMNNCPHNKQKNIIEILKDYVLKDENGNTINTTKIILEKKKREYPKTYEECCEIMGVNYTYELTIFENCDYKTGITYYEDDLLGKIETLYRLIVCRDAYWKIAGEEMGLDKPWKPDWLNEEGWIHCIYTDCGKICCTGFRGGNKIFAFPTPEMRDTFKKNFDLEIEICKKFL